MMTTATAAVASSSRVRTRRQKVFRSVFPTDVSQPTPLLPATAPGESFGGPYASSSSSSTLATSSRVNRSTTITRSIAASSFSSALTSASTSASTITARNVNSVRGHSSQPSTGASDQVRWDRAWHVVTSRIHLPSSVAVEDSFGTLAPESQDMDATFYESLALILDPDATLPRAAHTDDILSWHGLQVRQHFLHHVLPLLAACTSQRGDPEVLLGIVETLEAAHRQYLYGLLLIVRGIHDESSADAAMVKFRRDLHALVSNSWTPGLMQALRGVLQHTLRIILASTKSSAMGLGPGWAKGVDVKKTQQDLFRLLESLQKVGLAGEKFQVLFAEVMNTCMQDFVKETYIGVWKSPRTRDSSRPGAASLCMDHLCDWIENCYGRLAVEVLGRLGGKWLGMMLSAGGT
ncbi:hypothetical protein PT974_09146 [Cladobotryum mycophilum]|uniref:Uncharacterized protein n=1 Tax=Cladobotryum mycophilum TaxID=491253 RepID=A0ABR0SGB8_9HYPO